ncbi:MAG TPA: FHA domain-containing protein [Oxalicibacterium sp.]|nr:FHA domain-containing protein [Oxalicibacterium sp.]
MAAIILAKDGTVLQRIPLLKERTTIGRRTYNDIVIDEPGVSAEHAVLLIALGDLYFQDLGSTNGSRINGEPVQKHCLQDGDVIELGRHTMQYRANEDAAPLRQPEKGEAPDIEPEQAAAAFRAENGISMFGRPALIEVLNGHHSGKKIPLTQPLTTIGHPHVQIAVLAKGRDGYSLTHVEGKTHPLVNGKSSGMATQALSDGDLIDLAGTKLRFSLGVQTQRV